MRGFEREGSWGRTSEGRECGLVLHDVTTGGAAHRPRARDRSKQRAWSPRPHGSVRGRRIAVRRLIHRMRVKAKPPHPYLWWLLSKSLFNRLRFYNFFDGEVRPSLAIAFRFLSLPLAWLTAHRLQCLTMLRSVLQKKESACRWVSECVVRVKSFLFSLFTFHSRDLSR